MKADWTRNDETITKALNDYGRKRRASLCPYGPDPKKDPRSSPKFSHPPLFSTPSTKWPNNFPMEELDRLASEYVESLGQNLRQTKLSDLQTYRRDNPPA